MPPECELRVQTLLERGQQHLLQPSAREFGEWLALEICKRGSAPEGQCVPLQVEGHLGLAASKCLPGLPGQTLEPPQVELLPREMEHVSRCSGLEPRLVPERSAELGDVAVHLRRRRDRRAARVQLVGEPVERDDPVRAQEQDRQRRPLLRATETNRSVGSGDLERPQDPELEHRSTVAVR